MGKSWLKGIARDLLALGSIPFYFLVVIRAVIGKYDIFVYQMLIAAITIFVLYFAIKDSSLYIARSFAVLVFTSLFYKEIVFTVFAGLVWALLLISAYYIKRNIKHVFRGLIIGVVSSVIGYYGTLYLL
ncbi:hypothetical protein HYX04_00405 [Candidatus Woesearchaeota archaeon]|nr:hypothetical protein [Candidatus Woesearchaeota archaeon]